jgi:carboxypeptidase C (cathepsin A)
MRNNTGCEAVLRLPFGWYGPRSAEARKLTAAGPEMNMFFWLFEARSGPKEAPLVLWLNGGPGCSSLNGLFVANGPCRFVGNDTEPSLNPYSWNNYANMLYADQPIGTGFSYGVNNVTSTSSAAPYVWNLLQSFYTAFPDYKSRAFGLFTESYGGRYGPVFTEYFQKQNEKIDAGELDGDKINLVALGINNAWADAGMVFESHAEYAYNNPYRKLINESQYAGIKDNFTTQCKPAIAECKSLEGEDKACVDAMRICQNLVDFPIESNVDFLQYDVREPRFSPNPVPSGEWQNWLTRPDVVRAIGAQGTFNGCGGEPMQKILGTGDQARSSLPSLSKVVRSGITVLLWAGDAGA